MMHKSAALGLLLGFAAYADATSAQAGPAVSTRWQDTQLTQEECLQFAEVAIKGAGFGQIERTTQSRYGTLGQYTATIRCVTEHKIIFFIMAGPSLQQAPKYLDDVYNHF
jgi:hypothetical protein